jgi:hypothetical protein
MMIVPIIGTLAIHIASDLHQFTECYRDRDSLAGYTVNQPADDGSVLHDRSGASTSLAPLALLHCGGHLAAHATAAYHSMHAPALEFHST